MPSLLFAMLWLLLERSYETKEWNVLPFSFSRAWKTGAQGFEEQERLKVQSRRTSEAQTGAKVRRSISRFKSYSIQPKRGPKLFGDDGGGDVRIFVADRNATFDPVPRVRLKFCPEEQAGVF